MDSRYEAKLDELGIKIKESWIREVRQYFGSFFPSMRKSLDSEDACFSDMLKMAIDYAEEGKRKEAGAMVNHLKEEAEKAGFVISGLERLLGLAHQRAIKPLGKN